MYVSIDKKILHTDIYIHIYIYVYYHTGEGDNIHIKRCFVRGTYIHVYICMYV
jgi:hypothetical protein